MRFFKNLYKSALVAVAGVVALTSCQPEESPLSRAILTSVSGMQFAAQNAEPQTITVYADADWTVEAPEWVTVDKTAGSRTMEVTVSVADNMRDGAIDNPKKDTIVFRGYNLLGTAYVIVNQDGDKFRDVPPVAVSDVLSMKDEAVVIFDEVQVVAAATNGFVVSDGTADVFVVSDATVAVGDKVDIWGSKGTANGLAAVTVCDKIEVTGNAAVVYPTATDITSSLDAYAPTKMEFVEVTGALNDVNVSVEGATKVATVYNPTSAFDLAALNGHNVTVKGYSAGATASLVNIVVTEIIDLGVDEVIYFFDNFDWVQPFVDADIAKGRTQGDSMLDNAQYTVSSSYDLEGFEQTLTEKGYEALFPASKAIYVMQGKYLKFSKGKNTNGIRLPAMNFDGANSVVLTFDWGINIGSGGPDKVELEVEIEGNGTIDGAKKLSPIIHTAGDWEWQTETITISGVDNETRITIKPTTFTGVVDAAGYYRWFLDNVKVVLADGAAPTPPAGGTQTLAAFPFPNDTAFTGEGEGAGTKWNLAEGWLLSQDEKSKMSAHKDDGSAMNVTYKYEARNPEKEEEGVKDHVRILATGMPKGGYWLFEVPVKDMPAGTYNITYNHSASATGPNYFLLEVSVDGQNWAPAGAQTTTETFKDGSNGREVTWTYALNKGGKNAANVACAVDVDYAAPALPGHNTLYVRAKIADDMAYGATKAMGGSGTNRIWGPCEITFAE